MARRKSKPVLNHRVFQQVGITDAWMTSAGARYFLVQDMEGKERQLLASPEYWISSPEEVRPVFNEFSGKHSATLKKKLAREHYLDRQAAKIAGAVRARMEAFDSETDLEHEETALY